MAWNIGNVNRRSVYCPFVNYLEDRPESLWGNNLNGCRGKGIPLGDIQSCIHTALSLLSLPHFTDCSVESEMEKNKLCSPSLQEKNKQQVIAASLEQGGGELLLSQTSPGWKGLLGGGGGVSLGATRISPYSGALTALGHCSPKIHFTNTVISHSTEDCFFTKKKNTQ